jgi:hypothetical protein
MRFVFHSRDRITIPVRGRDFRPLGGERPCLQPAPIFALWRIPRPSGPPPSSPSHRRLTGRLKAIEAALVGLANMKETVHVRL